MDMEYPRISERLLAQYLWSVLCTDLMYICLLTHCLYYNYMCCLTDMVMAFSVPDVINLCMCVYAYMHIRNWILENRTMYHTHTYTHMHISTHTHTHTHTHTCMCTHTYTHTHTHMRTHTYTHHLLCSYVYTVPS